MMKPLKYVILFGCVLVLTKCKKYPENTLWFKNPEKISPFHGHLTNYTVNGIDSLDLLNVYYGNHFGLIKDVRQANFSTYVREKGYYECSWNHGNSLTSRISYVFSRKKKYMFVSFIQDTAIYRKHLFVSNSTEWKIIRLAKEGAFEIETTLNNGNVYQIQIE